MSSYDGTGSTKSALIKVGAWGAGSLTAITGCFFALDYMAGLRVNQQQAAIQIVNGKVKNPDAGPGVKLDNWFIGHKYIVLPTTLQVTNVDAGKDSQVTLRTKENSRIYANFQVHFELNKKDPNFKKIYTELKIDHIDNIKPFINNYVVPAATKAYHDVSYLDINTKQPEIAGNIVTNLQTLLDKKGYSYIKIVDVIPSGVGLSDEANSQLEQIVKEQRKKTLLEVQGQVADLAQNITRKQTNVSLDAINKLKQQGHMTTQEAIEVYYMQLLHVNDQLGQPNVPGPIPGTGVGTVASNQAPVAAPAKPAAAKP
jgi:hypothetical protein